MMQTIKEFQEFIKQEIKAYSPNTVISDTGLLSLLISAIATVCYLFKRNIDYAQKQIFIKTASRDSLSKHAIDYGITRYQARKIQATARVQTLPNTTIPSATLLKNGSLAYRTLKEVISSQDYVDVQIEALQPGTPYALQVNDILKITASISGLISPNASIINIIQTAEDEETDASLFNRIEIASRYRPRGGAKIDFRYWAMSVPFVADAYPYTDMPGEVIVYVESASSLKIPSQDKLVEVEKALWFDEEGNQSRCPMGVQKLSVRPVNIMNIYIKITDMTDMTFTTQDAVKSAINNYLLSRKPYIEGLTYQDDATISNASITSIVYETLSQLNYSFVKLEVYNNAEMEIEEFKYRLDDGQVALLKEIHYI